MSVSKIISGAAALLAFSGMASASLNAPRAPMYPRALNGTSTTSKVIAPYSTGGVSTVATTTATSAGSSATNTADDSAYCPIFDLQVVLDPKGIEFLIECGTNHFGLLIDIVFTGNYKRQNTLPTNLGDCMEVCDTDAACVATSFNSATQVCQFFETVGAAYTDANVDFAMKYTGAVAATTATASTGADGAVTAVPTLTGTITETAIGTIYSCAATVTDCPYNANNGALTTETISLYTTYCPVSGLATATAAACTACEAGASASGASASGLTATVYSATVATFSGLGVTSTIYVPVATAVVNYPVAAGTAASTVATTTVAASGVASASAASTTPSAGAFLGAAGHVEAGMGLAGAAAIMAFML